MDKIVVEADIQASQYPVENRIDDVNAKYLQLIEKATQLGSKEPQSALEAVSETFAVVDGTNTFTRTIKDNPIFRVDFQHENSTGYCRIKEDLSRRLGFICGCGMKFFADEKRIFIDKGIAGTVRVTYVHGNVVPFTVADYNSITPPSPVWLPEAFQPLLWLEPAAVQAEYYKKDRAVSLRNQVTRLENLFNNRYFRNAEINLRFQTSESCCGEGYNYR